MARDRSIAEAKDSFSRLVHEVEQGAVVQVTRRGRPVAVLLSSADYQRLTQRGGGFWDDLDDFRARHGLDEAGLEPESWLPAREAGSGRPVDL